MAAVLRLTVRVLDNVFHGRGNGSEPEWPPSPLRFYQALVAASATRWNERQQLNHCASALQWLETLPAPVVLAPDGTASNIGYRLYVPNNAADIVAASWKRGDLSASISGHRTEKTVRPINLTGDTLHYLFHLPNGQCPHLETLQSAARSITHLGWGIDMVVGDAAVITSDEADKLPGHRWRETPTGGVPLRVPMAGTLDDLMRKHQDFLQRISDDGFRPVPPLRAFRVARYHSATVASSGLPARPWCAFGILKPDFSRNAAFNTVRRIRDVAAWVRHATADIYQEMPECLSFVHGHDPERNQLRGPDADNR